jgi:hypothetical protein
MNRNNPVKLFNGFWFSFPHFKNAKKNDEVKKDVNFLKELRGSSLSKNDSNHCLHSNISGTLCS